MDAAIKNKFKIFIFTLSVVQWKRMKTISCLEIKETVSSFNEKIVFFSLRGNKIVRILMCFQSLRVWYSGNQVTLCAFSK